MKNISTIPGVGSHCFAMMSGSGLTVAVGYPDDKGSDPRELAGYDRLRGPVRRIECEVDPRTGMKSVLLLSPFNSRTSCSLL